jgi:Fe-S-cluster-containing dehydrogenase component
MEVERVDYMRRATLDTFNENPAFVYAEEDAPPFKSILDEYPYSDEYAWSMSIDQTACIGCNACIIACQAENNINTVGKDQVRVGREMHWIRVDRNDDSDLGRTDFQPVPCMHCEKAPCEQVCPVQATVHSNDGLNQMVYNRCVGTRYCAANCPYGVRRFNFLNYVDDAPIMVEVRNPDVSVRERGIMEKCSYCVQRINEGYSSAIKEDRQVRDGEVTPACASSCPTQAIVFGNQADASSRVAMLKAQPHNYGLLEDHNTQPRTTYLGKVFTTRMSATFGC